MKPLREVLSGVVNMRSAALRNGRSNRKDEVTLRATIGRVQAFLLSYPVASDGRVRTFCKLHEEDIAYLVPGNASSVFSRLVLDPIEA
jgi:hypothetical protein